MRQARQRFARKLGGYVVNLCSPPGQARMGPQCSCREWRYVVKLCSPTARGRLGPQDLVRDVRIAGMRLLETPSDRRRESPGGRRAECFGER